MTSSMSTQIRFNAECFLGGRSLEGIKIAAPIPGGLRSGRQPVKLCTRPRLVGDATRLGDGGGYRVDWRFRVRRLRSGSDRRIPIEEAGTAVAGEQFAFAQLVPGLGTNTHPTACTLLVVSPGDAGAAAGSKAVETGEQIGVDELAHDLAFRLQGRQLFAHLLLALSDPFAGLVERAGKQFHSRASRG